MFFQKESITDIISNFKPETINMLLIGEHNDIDVEELVKAANERGLLIAGGIFPMIVNEDQNHEDGIILKHVVSSEKPYLVSTKIDEASSFELPIISEKSQSCIILVDGLMDNIPRLLHNLYEKYWNKLSFVGGGAGSLSLKQTPCVFTNEGLFQDAAVLIPSTQKASSGVKHGWKKVAGPFVANKTDGNQIIELNWRPAFEVYKEVVEEAGDHNFDNSDFFDISKGFPFGIQKEGQEVIVRDPIAVDNNVLTCVGPVSQNVSLYILQGEKDSLINSAQEAAAEAVKSSTYHDSLVIDCISRVLYLGDEFNQELEAIQSPMNKEVPLEGALTLGEISSSIEGVLELYNKTTVVTTFA